MYHGRAHNDDHVKYQYSSAGNWQTPTDDGYYFQPKGAHDYAHANSEYQQQSAGWQPTSTNYPADDYYQISRMTVRTVEAPQLIYPGLNNNNAIINETIIREGDATRRHVDKHVPNKAKENARVKKHVHYEQTNINKEGKSVTTSYDENIDMEADDFIKQKHKKFELSKLMSMKAF